MPFRPARVLAFVPVVAVVAACSASSGGRPAEPASHVEAPGAVPTATPTAPPERAGGNARIPTFEEAKKLLVRLYVEHSPRQDVYCGCPFAPDKGHGLRVDLAACGYAIHKDLARAERIEWEHAVPAAKFGRTFAAWRDGDDRCVDGHGKRFRGRSCAKIASPEFARIEAALHNLFPAVGEVNGLRGDLPMGVIEGPEMPSSRSGAAPPIRFGSCASAVEGNVFQPRPAVRGDVARAYKYMNAAYPEHVAMDEPHRALFDAWDAEDPPDAWELERNRRITELQGNANPFVVAR